MRMAVDVATMDTAAVAANIEASEAAPVEVKRRRFTIREFEKMIRKRIFKEDERIELIDGEIIEMSPIELPHMVCVGKLQLLFHEMLGRTAHIWIQNATRMPNNSRPQPDVMVLKWRGDFYAGKYPTPDDILLVIEVAFSSLAYDRKVKALKYAAAGIQEYWIANVKDNVVEVYTNPTKSGYANIRTAGQGESLPLPAGLEGSISVDDIFG